MVSFGLLDRNFLNDKVEATDSLDIHAGLPKMNPIVKAELVSNTEAVDHISHCFHQCGSSSYFKDDHLIPYTLSTNEGFFSKFPGSPEPPLKKEELEGSPKYPPPCLYSSLSYDLVCCID